MSRIQHRRWHARGLEALAAQVRKTRLSWKARAWKIGYKDGEPEVSRALSQCEEILRAAAIELRGGPAPEPPPDPGPDLDDLLPDPEPKLAEGGS